MKITILGNGGAINDGLPYNSFLVDDSFLAEAPPDIMLSLFREKAEISKLRFIYISHFHGDHYLGIPFLLLRLYFDSVNSGRDFKITIAGPPGIEERVKEICAVALRGDHPVIDWIDGNFTFTELSAGAAVGISSDKYLKIFAMKHSAETYGFAFYKDHRIVFSYFADTVWFDELIGQIKMFPDIILTDLNGEPSDPVKVHMTEQDLIENAIPESEGRITFYGTHLKKQKRAGHGKIKYVKPGDVIKLK